MFEKDALPHARRPQQSHCLTFANGEIYAIENYEVAETLLDAMQFNHCSRSFARATSKNRISTDALTTAAVVERPTPSAPCLVLKPM